MNPSERIFINKISLPSKDEKYMEVKYSYYDMDKGTYSAQHFANIPKSEVIISEVRDKLFPERFLFKIPFLNKHLRYDIDFLEINKEMCFKIDWESFKIEDPNFNEDIIEFIQRSFELYEIKKYIIENLMIKNNMIKNMKEIIKTNEYFNILEDIIKILDQSGFIKNKDYTIIEKVDIEENMLNMDLTERYYPIDLLTKDISKLEKLKKTLEEFNSSKNKEGEK